ncbi:MAG: hypothetical protein AB7O24_06440 [Kofleriaceae bacterium]
MSVAVVLERIPEPLRAGLVVEPLTSGEIRARSRGEVATPAWDVLFDERIFGAGWEDPIPAAERERVESEIDTYVADIGAGQFGHIELGASIEHPLTREPIEAIAVIPPALRPITYLHPRRFAASDINDLYLAVLGAIDKLRRLRGLDPTFPATTVARGVEALMLNMTGEPVRMPYGRPLRSIADHLRLGGREPVRALLWGIGLRARWAGELESR